MPTSSSTPPPRSRPTACAGSRSGSSAAPAPAKCARSGTTRPTRSSSSTAWDVIPDATSSYIISGYDSPQSATSGSLIVSTISGDLTTITITGATLPTANGGLSGATLRIVNATGRDTYRTIASNTATTITVTDAWGTGIITAGALVYVVEIPGVTIDQVHPVVHDATTPGVVIVESGGSTRLIEGATSGWGATDSYTVRLTMSPAAGETITVRVKALVTSTLNGWGTQADGVECGTPDGCAKVQLAFIAGPGQTLDTNGDLLLTFTSGTSGNWMTPQTVTLVAPANSQVEGQDLKAFPARERRTHLIQGPLSSAAATTPARPCRSRSTTTCRCCCRGSRPVTRCRSPPPPPRRSEPAQVDTLVVHDEDSAAVLTGRLWYDPQYG